MSEKHLGAVASKAGDCKSLSGVDQIACTLNSGDGAAAQRLLNDATHARVNADPEQHKSWKELTNPNTSPDDRWKAADKNIAAVSRVEQKLWKDVDDAQAKTAGPHLCKLEIYEDPNGAPARQIKNTETCKNPPIELFK